MKFAFITTKKKETGAKPGKAPQKKFCKQDNLSPMMRR